MKYPKPFSLEEALCFLGDSPYVHPETREAVTLRVLRGLSALSSEKWAEVPLILQRWYDKCQREFLKAKRVYYYPDPDFIPISPTQELGRYRHDSIFTRICELILMDYRLTPSRIFDILTVEKRKSTLKSVVSAFYNIKTTLAIMQTHNIIDMEKLYAHQQNLENAP